MKVFLDANILFSLAWKAGLGLWKIFEMMEVDYCTCDYAIQEARRNLPDQEKLVRLGQVLENLEVVPTKTKILSELEKQIRQKDWPILASALQAKCDVLLTGDFRDFGHLFEQKIEGVLIVPPRIFFEL